MTLQKETRDAIGRTVRSLRELFEGEFGKQASGRFGIRSSSRGSESDGAGLDAWLDPVASLSLTPAEFAQRNELIHALRYLTSEGNGPGESVARLIREAAFTAVNRLLAIRVAEAIGVLPPVLSSGRHSAGYRDTVSDLFPGLAHDEDDYWIYVQVAGDELASAVPRLFDRRHPTSAFIPSRACVDEALELLTAAELAGVWQEPETLGWGYQFFNGDDVKQMRNASSAPRNSRELAVRNQFFTPRYVVDWLVQNTLGRRLVQAGYELDLPLLVGEVGDNEPLALEDVRVLDPAAGSGHFLLGSYDLLEHAWQSTGVAPAEAASRILPCLFGVDIDPRAAQVAQAVLLLRARQSAPAADLTPPTIVTAVALPQTRELREQVLGKLSPASQVAARDVAEALDQAPLLGSLLKVEQRLAAELAGFEVAPRLIEGDASTVLADLHLALGELVSDAASPEERMFTAEAADALRFLEVCQRRYDAVLMNPPFGDPITGTKDYLQAAYGPAATDIYAAFVSRGVELLRSHGHVGAITSRTGFFLTSFRDWRADELLPRLRAMLDLGVGVMHDAMVEPAAYVLQHRPHSGTATFRRLIDEPDRAAAVYTGDGPTFDRHPRDFKAIPEQPAAYWLPDPLLQAFADTPALEQGEFVARRGAYTGDDFQYLRLWWEVPRSDAFGSGVRWVPFAKGGEYSPYYSDLSLVVDWDYERGTFRDFHGRKGRSSSIPENRDLFGRPGLGWSRRSQKGFSVRPVPSGAIFADKGPMVLPRHGSPNQLAHAMAYLNSGLAAAALEAMIAFGSYEVGAVQRLPVLEVTDSTAGIALDICDALRRDSERIETDHLFVVPWLGGRADAQRLVELSAEIDYAVAATVGHDEPIVPLSATYPTLWFEEDYQPVPEAGFEEELSYMVGVALGRWDVRYATGIATPQSMPGPFDPLPPVSRGMLIGADGEPASKAPVSYPIDFPPDRLLHDDPGHPQDICAALDRVSELLEASPAVPVLALSDVRDLRSHLRNKFFAAHLRRYSASRRFAPIYWQLAVPSKRWGLWLYAPSLSRESLFAIGRAAREKLSSLKEQVSLTLERSGTDREARERVENLEELAAEIEKFAAVADEAAQSGWEPDLNDGFVLNASPLEDLFVDKKWRGQVAQHRKAMQQGDYPWATVQREFVEKRT